MFPTWVAVRAAFSAVLAAASGCRLKRRVRLSSFSAAAFVQLAAPVVEAKVRPAAVAPADLRPIGFLPAGSLAWSAAAHPECRESGPLCRRPHLSAPCSPAPD